MNYDRLWENEKLSDENQRFYWIKSIHWYRLANVAWPADIYGIRLSHIFVILSISYQKPSISIEIQGITNQKFWDTRFFTPWIWNTRYFERFGTICWFFYQSNGWEWWSNIQVDLNLNYPWQIHITWTTVVFIAKHPYLSIEF